MKKKVLCSLLAVMLTVSCTSGIYAEEEFAETGEETGAEMSAAKEEFVLGYTCPTLNNPFFDGMMEGAEKAAEERGVTLTMLGGDNDVTKQVQQEEDFISQGMDAIIVQTVDTTGIVTAIESANDAGIPVFTTAELPTGGDIQCAISYDSYGKSASVI